MLRSMADAGEPTWIIAANAELSNDRAAVEVLLAGLRQAGLVGGVLEEGGEPGKETELDRWWTITDKGWDLLGLIKSPRYW
jgi:hypothetical protein